MVQKPLYLLQLGFDKTGILAIMIPRIERESNYFVRIGGVVEVQFPSFLVFNAIGSLYIEYCLSYAMWLNSSC